MNIQKILDEFREQFQKRFHICERDSTFPRDVGVQVNGEWEHIESFIRTAIESAVDEMVECVEKDEVVRVNEDGTKIVKVSKARAKLLETKRRILNEK